MSVCILCNCNVRGIDKTDSFSRMRKGIMLPSGLSYCKKCMDKPNFDWNSVNQSDVFCMRKLGFWFPTIYDKKIFLRLAKL
jgi:hypothetical protein